MYQSYIASQVSMTTTGGTAICQTGMFSMPKRFSQKDRPEDGIPFFSEHKGWFYGRFLSLLPATTLRGSLKVNGFM